MLSPHTIFELHRATWRSPGGAEDFIIGLGNYVKQVVTHRLNHFLSLFAQFRTVLCCRLTQGIAKHSRRVLFLFPVESKHILLSRGQKIHCVCFLNCGQFFIRLCEFCARRWKVRKNVGVSSFEMFFKYFRCYVCPLSVDIFPNLVSDNDNVVLLLQLFTSFYKCGLKFLIKRQLKGLPTIKFREYACGGGPDSIGTLSLLCCPVFRP